MKIAVLGCGTAGVVSVCHWLHYGLKVEVNCIYDKDIKTLGIGESTNVHLPNDLFLGLDIHILHCRKARWSISSPYTNMFLFKYFCHLHLFIEEILLKLNTSKC